MCLLILVAWILGYYWTIGFYCGSSRGNVLAEVYSPRIRFDSWLYSAKPKATGSMRRRAKPSRALRWEWKFYPRYEPEWYSVLQPDRSAFRMSTEPPLGVTDGATGLRYWVRQRFGSVALWLPLVIVASATLLMFWIDRRRIPPGHCRRCGYDLTGNTSGICSECGTMIAGD